MAGNDLRWFRALAIALVVGVAVLAAGGVSSAASTASGQKNQDFSLAVAPSSLSVVQGGSGSATVTLTPLRGFNGTVSLSASGLPSGATATLTPSSITGSGASQLAIATTSSTPTGTYTVTATGVSGPLTHTATLSLTVTAPAAPDFSLSAAPTSLSVVQGGSGSATVTLTPLHGFNGTVSLSASGLPSGATATLTPSSITGSGASQLAIATTSSTPAGTYTVTAKGVSAALTPYTGTVVGAPLTHTATLSLTVTAPAAPDFSLSAAPTSLSVVQGGSGSATVTLTPLHGFNGTVSLSASGLPSGATATLTPSSITGSGASQLAIATTSSTPAGTYTVTAKGVSGPLTHTATLALTVTTSQLATLLPPPIPQSNGPAYYVATTGSDANPGSLSSPWRTIQKALNTLKPGEQAYVRGGTYVQSVVMTRAGTSSAPITVQAYPGEKPIIRAGGQTSMDHPVRITAGAAWFRMSGFIVENAPLDTTVNVYISDGQKAQPYAAHDIEFSYNEVRNGLGTGLLVAPRTNNVQLIGNRVHDNGLGTQHQHQGMYFQGQNGLIANNVVYNQPHGFGIQVRGEDTGIYANNIIVVGNTSVGNQLAGFVVENTAGNVKLINNISAFNGTYGIHAFNCCGQTAPGNEAYNNILFGNPSGPTRVNGTIIDFSKGNTVADPQLADRSNNDYRLKAASPALGKSLPAYTATRDADTKTRPQGGGPDVGAYER